jgi:site-specific recombinase XerD
VESNIVRVANGDISATGTVKLPALIASAGERASRRFIEFFTANIRNRNTRQAYALAIGRFLDWCEANALSLNTLETIAIAGYVEKMMEAKAAPTVKQHLAAIRMLMDWLVVGQVLPFNPAASVRGPRHVVKKGKTLVLSAEQARQLLDSIDTSTLVGLRDRALIGAMVYSFARVSAVVNMNVEDYWQNGKRWWLRLHEKGGKHHEVPAHHRAEEYLDAYLHAAGIPAVPTLIQCVREGTVQEVLYAQKTLVTIGEDAAQAIAELLPSIGEEEEYINLLSILESMGRHSAPAVPALAKALDATDNKLLVHYIVRTLFFCGPPGAQAIPALVRCIIRYDSSQADIHRWIKRTLACHLPHSADALREQINAATGDIREQLETILAGIDRGADSSQNQLRGFRDLRAVERFVALADLLLAKGPNSLRGVAASLKGQSGKGRRNGFSANNLSRALKSLEKWLREPLTSPRTYSTFALTPYGKAILKECKQFLKNSDRS